MGNDTFTGGVTNSGDIFITTTFGLVSNPGDSSSSSETTTTDRTLVIAVLFLYLSNSASMIKLLFYLPVIKQLPIIWKCLCFE